MTIHILYTYYINFKLKKQHFNDEIKHYFSDLYLLIFLQKKVYISQRNTDTISGDNSDAEKVDLYGSFCDRRIRLCLYWIDMARQDALVDGSCRRTLYVYFVYDIPQIQNREFITMRGDRRACDHAYRVCRRVYHQ